MKHPPCPAFVGRQVLRPPPPSLPSQEEEEEEEEDSFPQEGEIEGGGAGDKLLLKRWPKP